MIDGDGNAFEISASLKFGVISTNRPQDCDQVSEWEDLVNSYDVTYNVLSASVAYPGSQGLETNLIYNGVMIFTDQSDIIDQGNL